jgi:hypothetical protein
VRRALLALAVLAGVLIGPATVGPAAASTISGACTSAKGVTVVVNFASLRGGTVVRCDSRATSGTTGVKALQDTGFHPQGTGNYGLAFVCRISDKPTMKQDPCAITPPATAYWSYWYAANGGAWTYSNKGATNRHVIVGGFEGWVFHQGTGGNATPTSGSPPTRPVAAKPKPKPKPSHSSSGSSNIGSSGSSGSSGSTKGTASSGGQALGAATDHPTGPGSSATAGSSGTSSEGATGATPTATSTDASAGSLPGDGPADYNSPLPLALGGLGVVALLVGAGVMVTRRRRPDGS